jgi:hypothetical protein
MKEFFLILFFAKVISLTNEPIDVNNRVSFDLKESVSAITSGAHIRIDVTNAIAGTVDLSNSVSVLDTLKVKFPDGSVKAVLTADNGEKTVLDKISGSTNGEVAELILSSSSGVPTGIEFSKLELESSRKLEDVKIAWQNYYK